MTLLSPSPRLAVPQEAAGDVLCRGHVSHTIAGALQHLPQLLPLLRTSCRGSCSAPPHKPLWGVSAGFTWTRQQSSGAERSACTAPEHGIAPQHCSVGVFSQHSLKNHFHSQERSLPSRVGGEKPNTSFLATNMPLVNMVALWFSNRQETKQPGYRERTAT